MFQCFTNPSLRFHGAKTLQYVDLQKFFVGLYQNRSMHTSSDLVKCLVVLELNTMLMIARATISPLRLLNSVSPNAWAGNGAL